MKLRLTRNSVRLRLLRTDLQHLVAHGRIEDTIRFGPESALTFALLIDSAPESASDPASDPSSKNVQLRHSVSELAIVLPRSIAHTWAETEQVGIYATIDVSTGDPLDLIVEKDFACLDLSDADNVDTFPHPEPGATC